MSETKWTKGPWKVEEGVNSDDFIVSEASGSTVCEPNVHISIDPRENYSEAHYIDAEEARANASLISVAPQLYEQLEKAVAAVQWMSGSSDFSPGHSAHKGWLKTRSEMDEMIPVLKSARGEK